jgi:hypothetical protein
VLTFLSKLWKPTLLRSTLVFDEAYCHSAGEDFDAKMYEIQKGTTEIVFQFGNFPGFMETHFWGNPYIPENLKRSIEEGSAGFCAQVVQDGPYLCTDDVNSDGSIVFCSQTLRPLHRQRRLRRFSRGAMAFGIVQPDSPRFNVLWATMYQAQ